MRTKLLTRKKERARVEKGAEEVIYPQARLEGLPHSCRAKNSTAAPYKLKQIAQQENICLGCNYPNPGSMTGIVSMHEWCRKDTSYAKF